MLGEHHPNSDLLKTLLIGDREAIILGIRRATYGDDDGDGRRAVPALWATYVDLNVTLDDIPEKRLDDPIGDVTFFVDLWKGGKSPRSVSPTVTTRSTSPPWRTRPRPRSTRPCSAAASCRSPTRMARSTSPRTTLRLRPRWV
jgi:hypothetical protein